MWGSNPSLLRGSRQVVCSLLTLAAAAGATLAAGGVYPVIVPGLSYPLPGGSSLLPSCLKGSQFLGFVFVCFVFPEEVVPCVTVEWIVRGRR